MQRASLLILDGHFEWALGALSQMNRSIPLPILMVEGGRFPQPQTAEPIRTLLLKLQSLGQQIDYCSLSHSLPLFEALIAHIEQHQPTQFIVPSNCTQEEADFFSRLVEKIKVPVVLYPSLFLRSLICRMQQPKTQKRDSLRLCVGMEGVDMPHTGKSQEGTHGMEWSFGYGPRKGVIMTFLRPSLLEEAKPSFLRTLDFEERRWQGNWSFKESLIPITDQNTEE